MPLPERESPIGKNVSLFSTCMVDMLYPETAWSVVEILEHLGIEVDYPAAQTCCGQPAYNAGHRRESRKVAIQFLKAFKDSEVIVAPSGSCVAMVRHEYPALFTHESKWKYAAMRMASITWELTEFVVEGLGITDLNLRFHEKHSFAFHDSCHGLRLLGLGRGSRELLGKAENVSIENLSESDVCCGFGGLFSVKMANISGAMLERKIANIEDSSVQTIICGDVSCMTHMNGGLQLKKSSKQVKHIADVLAEGLRGESG